jgi:hypothetical protein
VIPRTHYEDSHYEAASCSTYGGGEGEGGRGRGSYVEQMLTRTAKEPTHLHKTTAVSRAL